MNQLIETIISRDDNVRNRSITGLLEGKGPDGLLNDASELEEFRKSSDNLYHKVRASLFLHVLYRFYLQEHVEIPQFGIIPFKGVLSLCERDFEGALALFLSEVIGAGKRNGAIFSAIAEAYHKISFQYLLHQVKRSISECRENYHLYHISGLSDYPYSAPAEYTTADPGGAYPIGVDRSPVRLDPSHSGWSDIFFLGMDFPEGARVVNISVNLKVHGADANLQPPCECYSRYIRDPVIRLASVDLRTAKEITTLDELFNFGNDHLSLLKAGIVASGIMPPCFEGRDIEVKDILLKLLGLPGGIEVVTKVNNIPKGSRLAVSTTLLATIITRLMRFSGQIRNQEGPLSDDERRTVASRAILGEWLGGSGGGWQDSGGLWPGVKVITGRGAEPGSPEHGVSRGCLLPEHNLLQKDDITSEVEERIVSSMVLVHGGMSQDVGPVLEMVTEKYLLKYTREWTARLTGMRLFERIVSALKRGDMKELGRLTTQDWEESIQQIIPAANNAFTEKLIQRTRAEFNDDFWGFLMLGGMSGGGMAFIINPAIRNRFKSRISVIMREMKEYYESSFPFIIDPVVYDFEVNHNGIIAGILRHRDAVMPVIPVDPGRSSPARVSDSTREEDIKEKHGYDPVSHEYMRGLLKAGEIGLRKNRLPPTTSVEDVDTAEIEFFHNISSSPELLLRGTEAMRRNEIAVVTFAGGLGSRWSHGAGVVKPVCPFVFIEGSHRSFLEIHIAKSRKSGILSGQPVPHVFTTSYLTHDAIRKFLKKSGSFGYDDHICLSPSKSIGRRVYPMERDLRFLWYEELRQKKDVNVQKVDENSRSALIEWTRSRGEGEDYGESRDALRFNPPGHWHEIPNLLRNGVLAHLLKKYPELKYLFCHNTDTVGAYIDAALLGAHIARGKCLTFEVTPRRMEDEGGGLAKIDGHMRIVEGLALPATEDEYRLSFYNSLTNWITIDSLLKFFNLDREIILDAGSRPEYHDLVMKKVREVEKRIPTYVTIKNVSHIWGNGQEDIYPVAQFEKLWGDMTGLRDLSSGYFVVPRRRGQQLKRPSQLDVWMLDGSLEYIRERMIFENR
jgi:galactokinase/mevalonate kinase-like predicted kinase